MNAMSDLSDAGVVIIGAGQAGLATSHELKQRGVDHVVLEAARVGQAWRDRWDSFTLVTPNWTLDLPGQPYDGDDPQGFVPGREIVAYLERYANEQAGLVHEGVRVDRLAPIEGGFRLQTSNGDMDAHTIVISTGAFQRPHRPVSGLPPGLLSIDGLDYRNPGSLPDGGVLVIGSGQTGCQLAEELHLAGRRVVLACGRAPWAPRRLLGIDIVEWLVRTTFYDHKLADLPSPAARLFGNIQTSGGRGGHDLNYRTLQALGVELVGRLQSVDGQHARFADDLSDSVAFGDARYADMRTLFTAQIPEVDWAQEMPDPAPFRHGAVTELDLSSFGAVINTCGFRPDYARWVDLPVFDDGGFPIVDDDGRAAAGLHFCGVHFMRTRRSSLLFGVGRDAAVVAEAIANSGR